MNKRELFIFKTCMENGCTIEQAKAICQVYNTERKRLSRRKEQARREYVSIVSLSAFPKLGESSDKPCFVSQELGPEDRLIRKEEISFLMYLVEFLPEKYRSFTIASLDNGCVGVFEEKKSEKYGEVQKMAQILGISTRTVRRYVIKTKELLYERGKYMLGDAFFYGNT